MRSIGIDLNDDLYYEGDNTNGRGIWPSPTVMVATVMSQPLDEKSIGENTDLGIAPLVFREDVFDPVARLRRGRFYSRMPNSGQPHPWHVHPHPALPGEVEGAAVRARFQKSLHGFYAWPASQHLVTAIVPSIIALGPRQAYSLWRVLDTERIVTGEDLVTLKARAAMGVLPELKEGAVPANDLPRTRRVLDALVDAAHTAGSGSIVDRARDATQWCVGVWWANQTGESKYKTEDLSSLLNKIPTDGRRGKGLPGPQGQIWLLTGVIGRWWALCGAELQPNRD